LRGRYEPLWEDNVKRVQELNPEQDKIEQELSRTEAYGQIVSEERTRQIQLKERNIKSTFDSNAISHEITKRLDNLQIAETELAEKQRLTLGLQNQMSECVCVSVSSCRCVLMRGSLCVRIVEGFELGGFLPA